MITGGTSGRAAGSHISVASRSMQDDSKSFEDSPSKSSRWAPSERSRKCFSFPFQPGHEARWSIAAENTLSLIPWTHSPKTGGGLEWLSHEWRQREHRFSLGNFAVKEQAAYVASGVCKCPPLLANSCGILPLPVITCVPVCLQGAHTLHSHSQDQGQRN